MYNLIGIPFVNRGRDENGCDCWGLVRLVYKEFGVELPDYPISCFAYKQINNEIDKCRSDWYSLKKPIAPCLVLFKTSSEYPDMCTHCGVFIGNNRFIHTFRKKESCIESLDHPYWSAVLEGFYRYAGQ